MQYPLISEYVRAIQDASNNLDKLAHLVPVLDDHGEPYRSSGAFAVVFKMNDEQTGKCYALKCFTEEQEGRAEAYRQIADELEFVDSSYITSVKYLDKEIFVDSSCEEDEFPVLLMDWIDGETMENYIAENYQDNYAMAMLCYRFCKMAAWLRSQPFAHGDIKPDNIMVRPDGNLTLVDYDGMFVPAMKGQKSPTIGTKDFSHPLRTVDDFDETIDDFALASIALSLKAISLKPSLLDEYGAADRLLFSAEDYRDLSKSKVLAALQELMNDEEFTALLSMFLLANAKKNLSLCSFRAFSISKPLYNIDELIKQADQLFEISKDGEDHKKAFQLYSLADAKGSLYAKACLGYCYCLGKGVSEDKEKGLSLIRTSANAGNAKGQNIMGLCYANGLGVVKSYETAIGYFHKSAEQGNAAALRNLGVCYAKGLGVPQSYEEAFKWYRKLAEQGDAAALRNLGVCYYKGYGVPQNYEEAVKWYRKSADQGNAAAQNNLGVCYENGQGVQRSYEEAIKWYRKSAEQGNACAQHILGVCYDNGQGVPQSYEEAVKWYCKSAEQDNAAAQNNLGVCYENGQGVQRSYEEAIKWYRKSAEQGNACAQCNLAYCYEKGIGVTLCIESAIFWYKKSAISGYRRAIDSLKRLKNE
uniref:protein kinase domain-containing protein n=1 Tax=Prevotella sp. TaxID=59823 RepID=UPI0040265291